ncbi:MAG: Eco57I restriction-modification methylase domain-containing protein, partial [Candidatus Hodarchaeales archaeon]
MNVKPGLLLNLSKEFPFSLEESSITTLGPRLLSFLCENLAHTSRMKKKIGKFYTLNTDAEILSFLALYRYFKWKSLNTTDEELLSLFIDFQGSKTSHHVPTIELTDEIRILDPACGSGEFLYQTALIFEKIAANVGESVKLVVTGMDMDPITKTVTTLRLLLLELLWIIKYSQPQVQLALNIINADFLTFPFENKFDIIIGNPPWVRHEDIGLNKTSDYKSIILRDLLANMNQKISFDKKSDLYIYFCMKSLSLLSENLSVLALITSNAWLEVNYGKTLQNYVISLLSDNKLVCGEVIHQAGLRLWKKIGINSVMFLATKCFASENFSNKFLFTESNKAIKEIDFPILKHGVIFGNEYSCDDYRTENVPIEDLQSTHKWAGYFLRASSSVRKVLSIITNEGVSLSEIADIRFGIKTGANDFFYIQSSEQDFTKKVIDIKNSLNYKGKIEREYIQPIEREYIQPIVKSPNSIKGYIIPGNFIPKYWVFNCRDNKQQLLGKFALEYVKWGEKQPVVVKQGKKMGGEVIGFHNLSSLNQRPIWYSLTEYFAPILLWTKSYHDKPSCLLNQALILPDQRFYSIFVHN